jgi:predicted CXXCH cytochrome family protein
MLCHNPHGSGVPNDVVQTIGDSCRSCHPVGAPGFADAHAKYSMEQSSCVSCHNPHSFDRGKALLGKNQHTPFAARRCNVCHQGGAGSRPSLIKPQKELCLGCHPASSIMPAKNAAGAPMVQHGPVTQGLCTTCHNPHATDHPNHLKAKLDQTCFVCHGKVEEATLSLHEHAPVATGNCLLCHEGHTSPEAHLLNRPPIQLCESCHTTQGRFSHPVGLLNGRTVRDPNTGGMLVCASCHAVHGSDTGYLLPQEETALCRSCHSK